MKKLWISCSIATGQVNVSNENIIIGVPAIWQKFYGLHYIRLINWLKTKCKEVDVIEM